MSRFTQKHYIEIAKTLQETKLLIRPDAYRVLVHNFIVGFKEDNEKFNEAKFLKACGIEVSNG